MDSPEKWKFGSYYYRFEEKAKAMKKNEKISIQNNKCERNFRVKYGVY